MKILLFIAVSILLSSCSMVTSSRVSDLIPDDSPQLKNIIIKSFGTQKFSGLLGLAEQQDGLYYLLLDATGLKLLEVEVYSNGDYTIKYGIKRLADSRLPQILARSLRNIYIIEPAKLPCATDFVYNFCEEPVDRDTKIKYTRYGPFPGWKVRLETSGNGLITYSEPWVGLLITLSKIDN